MTQMVVYVLADVLFCPLLQPLSGNDILYCYLAKSYAFYVMFSCVFYGHPHLCSRSLMLAKARTNFKLFKFFATVVDIQTKND